MRRKEAIKDYKLEPSESSKGKIKTVAVYIGEKHAITTDRHLLNQYKIALILFQVLLFAIVLTPLLFDIKSAYSWYVVMPGLVVLLLLLVSAIKGSSIFSKKEFLTRKDSFDIKAVKESLPLAKLAILVIHLIGKIVFIAVESKSEFLTLEIVGLLLTTVAITINVMEYVVLQKIEIVKIADKIEEANNEENDSEQFDNHEIDEEKPEN